MAKDLQSRINRLATLSAGLRSRTTPPLPADVLERAVRSYSEAVGDFGAAGQLVERLSGGRLTAADQVALAAIDTAAAVQAFGSVEGFLRTVADLDARTGST